MDSKQEFLEEIVKTWKPNREAEFRGFLCGVCQKEVIQAWHYMLDSDAYKITVHVCEKCQNDTNRKKGLHVAPYRRVGDEAGEYKAFQCDQCGIEVIEAWHIWNKEGVRLTEIHLCKLCGAKI